jgi:hypothetical protein
MKYCNSVPSTPGQAWREELNNKRDLVIALYMTFSKPTTLPAHLFDRSLQGNSWTMDPNSADSGRSGDANRTSSPSARRSAAAPTLFIRWTDMLRDYLYALTFDRC